MPDAHDRRGPWRDPHGLADARKPLVADIEGLPSDGNAIDGFDAVHELDLVAVRLAEPHPPAAARLVHRLDARSAGKPGRPLQIVLAADCEGEADQRCAIALLDDFDVVGCLAAAVVERIARPRDLHHAEIVEECFHRVEVGRAQPSVDEVPDLEHCRLPFLFSDVHPAPMPITHRAHRAKFFYRIFSHG